MAGVAVDVIPVDSRVPAYIERVDAPVSARVGAPLTVRAFLKGRPNELLHLAIRRGDEELASRGVVLDERGTAVVDFADRPNDSGVAFYRAALSAERSGTMLSESGAAVTIAGRGRTTTLISLP